MSVDLTTVYETIPVSDARTNMAELTDGVAFHRKRVILTKQGKACAALMPIGDLEMLHALDLEELQSMHLRAAGAEHEETVSLPDAAKKPFPGPWDLLARLQALNISGLTRSFPTSHSKAASGLASASGAASEEEKRFDEYLTAMQSVIVANCAPAVIESVENMIIAGVSSKIEDALSAGKSVSAVKQAIVEGVRESFERPMASARVADSG